MGVVFTWDQPHEKFIELKDQQKKQQIYAIMEKRISKEEQNVIDEGRSVWETNNERFVMVIPENKAFRDSFKVSLNQLLVTENRIGSTAIYYVHAQKYYSTAGGRMGK